MENGVVPMDEKTIPPELTVTQYDLLQQQLRDLTAQVGKLADTLSKTRESVIRIEVSLSAHEERFLGQAKKIEILESNSLIQRLAGTETKLRLDWLLAAIGSGGVLIGAMGKEFWIWLHGK